MLKGYTRRGIWAVVQQFDRGKGRVIQWMRGEGLGYVAKKSNDVL